MAERNVAMAILGIVAVIAVVGLVLLFKGGTGQGVYGGEMRQSESDLRPIGEEPLRYTSPVYSPDYFQYSHRKSWEGLQRDQCPDDRYPQIFDVSMIGGRTDCIQSSVDDSYWCCPLGGQAGYINTGVYE